MTWCVACSRFWWEQSWLHSSVQSPGVWKLDSKVELYLPANELLDDRALSCARNMFGGTRALEENARWPDPETRLFDPRWRNAAV